MKIKRFIYTASIGVLSAPFLSAGVALAASANLYLTSSGSVSKGSYATVYIKENSGSEPVNAARATLSYPASKLQFIRINSSSAFTIVAANSGGNGSVKVDRGALPAVSGTQTVATVTFKALTDSGSASVSISSGQVISSKSNADISHGKTGTTLYLTKPAAAPKKPAKDTSPPKISKISVSGITYISAVIAWTTSEPATSEISYGPTASYGLAAVESKPSTSHNITLKSALIEPGTTYHYSIKSIDVSGNATSSKDAAFTTTGAKVTVTVKDQNEDAVSGASIKLAGKQAQTDNKGIANLDGLTLGEKTGVITYKGHDYPFTVNITDPAKTTAANVIIKLPVSHTGLYIVIILLLLLLDFFIGWLGGRGALSASAFNSIKSKIRRGGPESGPSAGAASGGSSTIIKPGGQ